MVGLYRVSAAEQGQSGLELEAQQASVRTFVASQEWTLVAEISDVARGKDDYRLGFQAALSRCRQLSAVLAAARLDRITRRAHTLPQLLKDGYSVRAADMPGADDLLVRVYAATDQKERADQPAHRLWFEIERLRGESVSTMVRLAHAATGRGVPTPREGRVWTQYMRGAVNGTGCWIGPGRWTSSGSNRLPPTGLWKVFALRCSPKP